MQTAIPCFMMRGGTSKGAYFLASDLPDDVAARDRILLAVMGSPDKRQIDGIGGADPLTSKVAIVSRSTRPGIDVDYLFCQVWVDKAEVSTQQNCGNILAAVAPFAIERGLVAGRDGETRVRIFMVNTSQTVTATVRTPGGRPEYDGDAAIDGVPGTAAPIPLSFADTAGSTCGALLPTGRAVDVVNGVRVTCIDNGMPVVVMRADQMGRTGYETREALDDDAELKARVEAIRLAVGPMMNLGDVTEKTVPKMILVAPPREGGAICDALVHPAPRARHDRRVRGAQRRHRVPAARRAGGGGGRRAGRVAEADAGRAPDRREPGIAGRRRRRRGHRGRDHQHGAAALLRTGARPGPRGAPRWRPRGSEEPAYDGRA